MNIVSQSTNTVHTNNLPSPFLSLSVSVAGSGTTEVGATE